MLTVYSTDHQQHHGQSEIVDGIIQPSFEMPRRVEMVLERIKKTGLGDIIGPTEYGLDPVLRIHDKRYVDFLEHAWSRWQALNRHHDALPNAWPIRGLRSDRIPADIDGQLGFYSFDTSTPITHGTWKAIRSAANVALTGAEKLAKDGQPIFSLCRPPGHHAATDYMGGYCYFNNAAIAAQALRDNGAKRVAILDVDYHHGNGTQSIFYRRNDVLFVSLHGDPSNEYPYYLGYADELGEGDGLDFNANYPMPHGTDWNSYKLALDSACGKIAQFVPDALVVSLGVDTFELDPISQFKLKNDHYLHIGGLIAGLKRPTLFVMEGGYAVEDIGINAVNVLAGFEQK